LERALGCLCATGRSPGVLQTAARLAGRIRAPTEKQAEDEESGGREQQDHEEVREAFAEAEVREQRRQTKTGGETGDRTHPRTLGLCGSCRCPSGRRLLGGRWLARLRWRCRLALHAEAAAAAKALG